MDALQASLREKAIQNHRLESKVGEMNLRMSHNMEDLTKALAERDRFQVESKDLSSKLATVSEELQDVKAKYEVLKLSLEPPTDLKRKRDAEDSEFKLLAPAFREQAADRQNQDWSSTNRVSQFLDSRYESSPTTTTTPRPSMLSYISTSSDSSSPSPSTDASPRVSPIPGLQADLRATGVHSTPWSQSQHANPYTLHLSPMSTRPNTPSVSDSQRTTDPRQRAKVNATQSTPVTPTRTQSHSSFDQNATPTTTTTTHITQISSTVTKSPPKRPRASTVNKTPSNAGGRRPDAPEGARLGSEYRKRNISLRAMPLRSSPRRHTPVSIEDGELPTGDLEGAEQRAGRPDYSSAESS